MTTFTLAVCLAGVLAVGAVPLQEESETKVTWQQLPPAVQQAVKAHTKGATLRGFSKEIKDRQTLYEAEMRIGGRTRDVTFDERSRIVSVEEEPVLSEIPAAARNAIQEAVGTGTLDLVEKVTEGDATFYEAHITRDGKILELKLDANGKRVE